MNTFGQIFRISIFGESHGNGVGAVIDGIPAGISLNEKDFEHDILRRKSGARGTTPRKEDDMPMIMSGVLGGYATGAPLAIMFRNRDTRSSDYSLFKEIPRPGHADFVAGVKWHDFNDPRGGGHFSGRLTLPLVAAGTVARKVLSANISGMAAVPDVPSVERSEKSSGEKPYDWSAVSVNAVLTEVGGVSRQEALSRAMQMAGAEAGRSACSSGPDENIGSGDPGQCHFSDSVLWRPELESAEKDGDSLGGIVECTVTHLPVGLGEPFFGSVESLISHAVFSIPGVRGIEFGDGFRASRMRGSEHNDPISAHDGSCSRNGAGGINGGITNGNPVVFRVAFKPTSSIRKTQHTYNFTKGEVSPLEIPGRHDTCFALRTPVVVEAVAAMVFADLKLLYL